MPEVAFEVIRIADQAESSALKVENTLSRDPSLSARVLRLANSAFYGMSREVSSVQDSVIVLGMRTTKSLSLVAASFPWLHIALKGKGLKPELLWNHCISCAHFSKTIAKKLDGVDVELAFCIALLHDMGIIFTLLCICSLRRHGFGGSAAGGAQSVRLTLGSLAKVLEVFSSERSGARE